MASPSTRTRLALAATLLLVLGLWWGWLRLRDQRAPLDAALGYLPANARALVVLAPPAHSLGRIAQQLGRRPADEQLRVRADAAKLLGFDPADEQAIAASGLDLQRPFVGGGDPGRALLVVPARSDAALAWAEGRVQAQRGTITKRSLAGRDGFLATLPERGAGPHVAVVIDGRWLVALSLEDPAALEPALQAALSRSKGGSLGEQPAIRKALGDARAGWSALAWLDLGALKPRPEVEAPTELVGSALVATLHATDAEVVLEAITTGPIVARAPHGPPRQDGVAAKLSGAPLALFRLDLDPRELVAAAELDPHARRELEDARRTLRLITGLELDEDVTQNLVGPFGAAVLPATSGPAPTLLAWGAVRDEAAAKAALERAVTNLQATGSPIRRDSDGLVRVGPAGITVAHGHLWFGSEPQVTFRAIEQVAAGRGGLLAALPAGSREAFERAPQLFLHLDTPALVLAARKTPFVSHGASDALAALGELGAMRLTIAVEPSLVRATFVLPAPAGGWGAPPKGP